MTATGRGVGGTGIASGEAYPGTRTATADAGAAGKARAAWRFDRHQGVLGAWAGGSVGVEVGA